MADIQPMRKKIFRQIGYLVFKQDGVEKGRKLCPEGIPGDRGYLNTKADKFAQQCPKLKVGYYQCEVWMNGHKEDVYEFCKSRGGYV
jgi:hypothetical protein